MIAKKTFDNFSSSYKNILNKDIRFSGENADYFARYKASCIKKVLGSDFRGRILDFGCGIGLVSKHLRQYYNGDKVEIIGYDVSADSIDEAKKNIKCVMFVNNLDDFENIAFDAVIMANVLHHVRDDERLELIMALKRKIKKNGYIFIFEHNPLNYFTKLVVKSSVLDKDAVLIYCGEIATLLKQAGFQILKKAYIVFFPRCLKLARFLEPIMSKIPVGAQYMCIGSRSPNE